MRCSMKMSDRSNMYLDILHGLIILAPICLAAEVCGQMLIFLVAARKWHSMLKWFVQWTHQGQI